ncbi:hypothetical protein CEXT_262921 [Caerostris extrusa]|uniref:Uncharacterized protein n=1 Tax=Caerostris extrusa TaxID=172846 RepID=A0AAV4Q2G5_CAEEX|nr:hypothetical protein CEXT_262921 [Caerostris extrusa]
MSQCIAISLCSRQADISWSVLRAALPTSFHLDLETFPEEIRHRNHNPIRQITEVARFKSRARTRGESGVKVEFCCGHSTRHQDQCPGQGHSKNERPPYCALPGVSGHNRKRTSAPTPHLRRVPAHLDARGSRATTRAANDSFSTTPPRTSLRLPRGS